MTATTMPGASEEACAYEESDQSAQILANARAAQSAWAELSTAQRAEALAPLSEQIADRSSEIIEIIRAENGKPRTEAVLHEVLGSIQVVNHHCSSAPSVLADRATELPMSPHRKATHRRLPGSSIFRGCRDVLGARGLDMLKVS